MLSNTERVEIIERGPYTDMATLAPGERPIAYRDGSLVEYAVIRPVSDPAALPMRITIEQGVNGQAPQGAEGVATLRTIAKQEAKNDRTGRAYIATTVKTYLADFKAA